MNIFTVLVLLYIFFYVFLAIISSINERKRKERVREEVEEEILPKEETKTFEPKEYKEETQELPKEVPLEKEEVTPKTQVPLYNLEKPRVKLKKLLTITKDEVLKGIIFKEILTPKFKKIR